MKLQIVYDLYSRTVQLLGIVAGLLNSLYDFVGDSSTNNSIHILRNKDV